MSKFDVRRKGQSEPIPLEQWNEIVKRQQEEFGKQQEMMGEPNRGLFGFGINLGFIQL